MRARREPDFRAILDSRRRWWCRTASAWCGRCAAAAIRDAVRVGGADSSRRTLPQACRRGERIALVGGGRGVAVRAAGQLRRRHPGLDVVADGGEPTAGTARRVAELERRRWSARPTARGARSASSATTSAHRGGRGRRRRRHPRLPRRARRRAPAAVRSAGLRMAVAAGAGAARWRRQLVLPQFWWLETPRGIAVISVVMPAFNERDRIPADARPGARVPRRAGEEYEVIVADDGSTDDTVALRASRSREAWPQLSVIALRAQPGQGRGGARRACSPPEASTALFSDADLSTPIEELPRLRERLVAPARWPSRRARCPAPRSACTSRAAGR